MSNPYLNPDEDADLFEDPEGSDAAQSSKQNFVDKDYKLVGHNGKELPEDVQEVLGKYVNDGIPAQSNLPIEFQAVSSIFEFYSEISTFSSDGPLLAAVAHAVDEMTGGRVRLLYEKYEAERKLLYCNILMQFNTTLLKIRDYSEDTPDWLNEVSTYFESAIDIIGFVHQKAENTYREICGEIGQEPDEELIENGQYSIRDYITKLALMSPPALESEV